MLLTQVAQHPGFQKLQQQVGEPNKKLAKLIQTAGTKALEVVTVTHKGVADSAVRLTAAGRAECLAQLKDSENIAGDRANIVGALSRLAVAKVMRAKFSRMSPKRN